MRATEAPGAGTIEVLWANEPLARTTRRGLTTAELGAPDNSGIVTQEWPTGFLAEVPRTDSRSELDTAPTGGSGGSVHSSGDGELRAAVC